MNMFPRLFLENELPMLRSWRPLLREIDDLFNSFAISDQGSQWKGLSLGQIDEEQDHFVASFDMPGIGKENIDIELVGKHLRVRGERKVGKNGEQRVIERTVLLPDSIKIDAVEAAYENGVLRVFVPKAEEVKPKKIEISEGKGSFFKRITSGHEKEREVQNKNSAA